MTRFDAIHIGAGEARPRLDDLTILDIRRYAHVDLLGRVWELRANLTAYDAIHLALAEALDAPLVTCDRPLGATQGHSARIEVVRGKGGHAAFDRASPAPLVPRPVDSGATCAREAWA